MNSTQEIANQLVKLCRQGKFQEVQEKFYAPDAVSIEPEYMQPSRVEGLEAIIQKGQYFLNGFEVHSIEVSDPFVAGNSFSIKMGMDMTQKDNGQRMPIEEIAVYEVKEGKIVKEQFFF